jgi:hypothetical protein
MASMPFTLQCLGGAMKNLALLGSFPQSCDFALGQTIG